MGFKDTFLKKLQHFADETEARYAKKSDISEYSVLKKSTADEGYAASYSFTKNGTAVGDTINIPKDYTMKDADTKVCTEAGVPAEGLEPGDKYIDFIVNTAEGDGNEKHIYLPVKDIAVKCRSGSGISVDGSGAVSIKMDAASANGLSAGEGGLMLALATAESAGAMSAEDKQKLGSAVTEEDIELITAEEIKSLFSGQQEQG